MSYPPSTSCGEIGKILHIILNDVFAYKTNGTFIEIGAHDGMRGSFTYNLAHIGWHGLYCEPVPIYYNKCLNNHSNHPNVTTLNVAAGANEETLQIIEADTLSTMDNDTLEVYKNASWTSHIVKNKNMIDVTVKKLDTILEEANINNIDVMVLDVEGYEVNVFKGFNINHYKPKMIIIEIGDQFADYVNNAKIMEKFATLRNILSDAGYKLICNDVVDNVYVVDELFTTELRTKFSTMIKYPQYTR